MIAAAASALSHKPLRLPLSPPDAVKGRSPLRRFVWLFIQGLSDELDTERHQSHAGRREKSTRRGRAAAERPSDAIFNMLQCIARQGPANFIVSSTTEGKHAATSAHRPPGLGFDLQADPAYREAIMQAAENCGVVFQQDEYRYPSKDSNGGHLHEQLRLGKGGATGQYRPRTSK